MFTFNRNSRSPSTEICVHVQPKWVFTIDRNTQPEDGRFKEHFHEGEQITMVIEGELVFETPLGIFRLMAGDMIAVPPHVPHRVYAGPKGAKAVDAWNPPMVAYQPNTEMPKPI